MLFFFFSSRRRHTRWNCDWSSDVCSSDLTRFDSDTAVHERCMGTTVSEGIRLLNLVRSEERRVGKECRSRWSQYHSKKKNKRQRCQAQSIEKGLSRIYNNIHTNRY